MVEVKEYPVIKGTDAEKLLKELKENDRRLIENAIKQVSNKLTNIEEKHA